MKDYIATTPQKRLDICKKCSHLKQFLDINEVDVCDICHCFMRAKVLIPGAQCPLDRIGQEPKWYSQGDSWIPVGGMDKKF